VTTGQVPHRWLVTGAGGGLGHDLSAVLGGRADIETTALTRAELDITDAQAVDAAVAGQDVVVNAAAWTDVDGAESQEASAHAVNAEGPALIAAACARHGARLLHVSTDYVFAGDATEPYAEDAEPAPRSAYGRTKLAGERAVLTSGARASVVRTAWVYGEHGKNFVATMLRLAAGDGPVDVVNDQQGSPTWSLDLAQSLVALGESGAPDAIYHVTNRGETTWYGLARAVFGGVGADPNRVRPTTTDRYPRPAPRPAYSVLGTQRWDSHELPTPRHWTEALAYALVRLNPLP
jgi:dTDP-4-dehydrorhamnose reductase